MGTSNWQHIPFCVEVLMRIEPRRVLDVGVGFGRWGIIVREFCDVWFGRVLPEQWSVYVEGIEAFAPSISSYHSSFYNKIWVGDAVEVFSRIDKSWDVVILVMFWSTSLEKMQRSYCYGQLITQTMSLLIFPSVMIGIKEKCMEIRMNNIAAYGLRRIFLASSW